MNDTSKVEIKPVSEWCNLAVKYKQAGCDSVSQFILAMAVQCIRIPPTEIVKIRRAWREDAARGRGPMTRRTSAERCAMDDGGEL